MQFSINFTRKTIKIKTDVTDKIYRIILKFLKINILCLCKIIEKLKTF